MASSIPDSAEPPAKKVAARPERFASKRPPTQSAKALWAWVQMAGASFSKIEGTTWASSFAYYAFFALVPMLLLLLTLGTDVAAAFVGLEAAKKAAFKYVLENVPLAGDGQKMLAGTLEGIVAARGKIGVLAFVGLLWSSLGFFQSLVGAINAAWGTEPLNWWKLPLKNLQMVGVLLSALALGIVAPVVLKVVQSFLTVGGSVTENLFGVLAVLVPIGVLFFGFLLFYKLAPRKRLGVTFTMVWVPALLVTALLQICQQLFVLYSTRFTNFNAVYGAFGGVIALMLWTYLSGLVIVFGGCLCAAQREMRATPAGPAAPPASVAAEAPESELAKPIGLPSKKQSRRKRR